MARRFPYTDKEWPHGYLPDYLRIAEELGPAAAVCEIGVYAGGSLKMWRELFPDGTITGVDIDPGCAWPDGTHRVVLSQDDSRLRDVVAAFAPDGYDLVVDDASHWAAATEASFWSLWPLVKPGRYYVVEDWTTALDLGRWVPTLIGTLREGASTVTYTKEGLVIIRREAA